MKARNKRMIFALVALLCVGAASALISTAIKSGVYYLYPPEDVLAGKVPKGEVFRLGGLVKEGSLKHSKTKLETRFIVRDNRGHEVTVITRNLLPDLFKEGKSQVARGKMGEDGIFYAEEVMAKHDSEYMPDDVKKILEKEHSPADKASKVGMSNESIIKGANKP